MPSFFTLHLEIKPKSRMINPAVTLLFILLWAGPKTTLGVLAGEFSIAWMFNFEG